MAPKFTRKNAKKACVVGLDGVPFTLLQTMTRGGVMPRTAALMSRGSMLRMTASLPEVSAVSWSTFMTGKNPGEHGIFGFTDLKESSYEIRFPSFRDLKTETIWDLLGRAGLRSIVLNQPSTYPAREIPGVLISGFVAIDIEKAVQPARLLPTLAKHGYKVDVDVDKCRHDPERLFLELGSTLAACERVVEELWDSEPWSLMEVVVTGTDRLHHFVWDAWEDPSHPRHADFLAYYARLDDFVGHVSEKFAREEAGDNFFLLSDHGFCRARKEVFVNAILEREGYLRFDSENPTSLASISEDSKAFALDPARVYIHKRSRYPRGTVAEREVPALKRDLAEMFEGIVDSDGRKIVRRVVDSEEVYSGPCAYRGPDLLLIPFEGYDMKGKIGAPSIVGERRLQGMHTWDNAFFFSLRNDLVGEARELNIVEAPWIVLRSIDAVA